MRICQQCCVLVQHVCGGGAAPTSIHVLKEAVCFCRAQLAARRQSWHQIIDSLQNLFAEGMHEIA